MSSPPTFHLLEVWPRRRELAQHSTALHVWVRWWDFEPFFPIDFNPRSPIRQRSGTNAQQISSLQAFKADFLHLLHMGTLIRV